MHVCSSRVCCYVNTVESIVHLWTLTSLVCYCLSWPSQTGRRFGHLASTSIPLLGSPSLEWYTRSENIAHKFFNGFQGFIQKGGPGIPPPPQPQFSLPRNFKIEYGYYISYLHVTERKYASSKFPNSREVPSCFPPSPPNSESCMKLHCWYMIWGLALTSKKIPPLSTSHLKMNREPNSGYGALRA